MIHKFKGTSLTGNDSTVVTPEEGASASRRNPARPVREHRTPQATRLAQGGAEGNLTKGTQKEWGRDLAGGGNDSKSARSTERHREDSVRLKAKRFVGGKFVEVLPEVHIPSNIRTVNTPGYGNDSSGPHPKEVRKEKKLAERIPPSRRFNS